MNFYIIDSVGLENNIRIVWVLYGQFSSISKVNDNSKCDMYLKSPVSQNHDWNIRSNTVNCQLI